MLAISLLIAFTFTACEDKTVEPYDPEPIENPTPRPVDSLKAGAVSETEIRIQWRHSPDRDSAWFKEYQVELVRPAPLTPLYSTVQKELNTITFGGITNGAVHTFIVTAVSDSGKVSSERSISWATSRYFSNAVSVYGSAATGAGQGSGLRLFDGTSGPSVHMVAQGAQWHLGLYTRNDSLLFGSASVIGNLYTNFQGTPENVYVTDVLANWDEAALGGMLLDKDLRDLNFQLKALNLKATPATTNSQGAVFFVRVGSNHSTAHYAKVIVRKVGGAYLQGSGNAQFIQVVVSYQTAAGVPYAKIFAGK
jgi:hypothetical protein